MTVAPPVYLVETLEPCPSCEGSGWSRSAAGECRDCKGGKVKRYHDQDGNRWTNVQAAMANAIESAFSPGATTDPLLCPLTADGTTTCGGPIRILLTSREWIPVDRRRGARTDLQRFSATTLGPYRCLACGTEWPDLLSLEQAGADTELPF